MDALSWTATRSPGCCQEVFAVEMTTAIGTCNACGATDAVGAPTSFGRGHRHALPALRQRPRHDRQGGHTRLDRLPGSPHAASHCLVAASATSRSGAATRARQARTGTFDQGGNVWGGTRGFSAARGLRGGSLRTVPSMFTGRDPSEYYTSRPRGVFVIERQIHKHQEKLEKFKQNPTVRPENGESSEGSDRTSATRAD